MMGRIDHHVFAGPRFDLSGYDIRPGWEFVAFDVGLAGFDAAVVFGLVAVGLDDKKYEPLRII